MLIYDRDRTPVPSPGLRLLPWITDTGNPCFLKGDDAGTTMALYADQIEESHLVAGDEALKRAVRVLDAEGAEHSETGEALRTAAIALSNVLRVADSRGARLPSCIAAEVARGAGVHEDDVDDRDAP